jgi:hypothetical protein
LDSSYLPNNIAVRNSLYIGNGTSSTYSDIYGFISATNGGTIYLGNSLYGT